MSWKRIKNDSAHKERIKMRVKITRLIREFFWSKGFLEMETPIAVRVAGQEPYLHPIGVNLIDEKKDKYSAHLITSPEYSLKKLLASGFINIFEITKCFRNQEQFGGLHNPEFTMLEWYRVGVDYTSIMKDVEELFECVGKGLGIEFDWKRITMRDLWDKNLGVDLNDLLDFESIKKFAKTRGFVIQVTDTYEDIFFRIFLNEIESKLVEPTIVYEYPSQLAALSRLKKDDTRYSERFEVYVNGLEIANAFSELTDSREQLRRLKEEQKLRGKLGHEVYDIDEDFIEALREGLPECAGIALGVDRMIMVLLGVDKIEDVLAFPGLGIFQPQHLWEKLLTYQKT